MKKILLSTAFIAVSFTTFSQVAVGTTSPDASAALDVTSTIQGFLPPRMTQAQMNAIAAPAEGLIVYCSDCIPKGIYVNTGDGSTGDSGSSGFVNITNGEGSGTDTTTEIVDLISSTTGRIWMDRNLGATQAATSIADVAAAGDLYQWGRSKDGHQSKSSGITTTRATSATPGHGKFVAVPNDWTDADKTGLWQDGLNDPCPTGYRVPTIEEISAETVDAFPSSADGVNSVFAALKLPYTGFRYIDGSFQFSNTFYDSPPYVAGIYWTSTIGENYNIQQGSLQYTSSNVHRSDAFAIRCIKKRVNESATDTETERHDIISPTGRTWMDRNLGAIRAATSLTDADAYGDLYQWGRGKDGHQSRTSSTTTTIAGSAHAGHENFIVGNATTDYKWTDFAAEDALWPTGLNDPCPSGYRIPTGAELEAELNALDSKDANDVFAALKLPFTGYRNVNGELASVGIGGYYWGSVLGTTGPKHLGYKIDTEAYVSHLSNQRAKGLPIRCIKKE